MPRRTNIKGLKQCKSLSSKTMDQRGDQFLPSWSISTIVLVCFYILRT
jgi:hypothetical protein